MRAYLRSGGVLTPSNILVPISFMVVTTGKAGKGDATRVQRRLTYGDVHSVQYLDGRCIMD